jgi:ribosome maturation factor RimP
MMNKINPELYERLVKLIGSMGYELLGCELVSQGRHTLIRIYIDYSVVDNQKSITVEDCAQVSYQVSALLDVEDPIQGRYTLEVSSPGIDRPLFKVEHYKKYLGSRVKIKLCSPINKRRQYKGILLRVKGDDICLLVDDLEQEVVLPFSIIEKANLIADIHL